MHALTDHVAAGAAADDAVMAGPGGEFPVPVRSSVPGQPIPAGDRVASPGDWFLSAEERGNPRTLLDRRHTAGIAWSEGNRVVPLIDGSAYFAELLPRIRDMRQGDRLYFVDWRSDSDEQLLGEPGSEIGAVLAAAAAVGVDVRGLIWRSHLDWLRFSATENRRLGRLINAAGGVCALDMRVRVGGSHHQKFVVMRHPDRPRRDVAFLGGIDLCHGRRDDQRHLGDPQVQRMADVYGDRPAWHDVQLMVTGPAVGDVETVFRERWQDPHRLSRSPLHRLCDRLRKDQPSRLSPLPPQLPDPPASGRLPVQLLRTYPSRWGGYDFAPSGERSVARGYGKAIARARSLIYFENQYLWSREVVEIFADALRDRPELRIIGVLPHYPDQDGRWSLPPHLLGRAQSLRLLRQAGGDRVGLYGLENRRGLPVYVHAKVCVVDDMWASVGSDNFNLRSWTHDSELSAAVCDVDYAGHLRKHLLCEHLEVASVEQVELDAAFDTVAQSVARLQSWHEGGRLGKRPPGRLRPLEVRSVPTFSHIWPQAVHRALYDPDGRPGLLRLRHQF